MSSDPLGLDGAAASDDVAIRVRDVSKHYVMFQRPQDRFKQMLVPRLQRLVGREPKRYFTDFAALSGVSFDIRRGETVGIIGRNGSGKSTLLQIVCGTLRPTAGSVEVNGRIAALLELGAGFNPEFTGRENVFLNAAILGVPQREMEWRFDDIARFADIGAFIDQPVKTYSSGMYVRLAFATAINVDPDILVVDEALSVGDEAFQRKCFARIEEIKDKGGTILFVSHGAQTIVQLCSRAMLFDRGELLLQGRPKSVVAQYQRLVNASPEMAAEIREGIAAVSASEVVTTADQRSVHSSAENDASSASRTGADDEMLSVDPTSDYFDPSMETQSLVEQERRGAFIHDFAVFNLKGKQVNILQLGRRYQIRYLVDFTSPATEVGFGAWFKTTEGLSLAGAHSVNSAAYRTASVQQGEVMMVEFQFQCRLMPGAYFITCGVIGLLQGERTVMHRVIDAMMIRVASEPMLLAAGHFDLEFDIRTQRLNEARPPVKEFSRDG